MFAAVERAAVRLLRIPPPPLPPAGDPNVLRTFRASPRFLVVGIVGWLFAHTLLLPMIVAFVVTALISGLTGPFAVLAAPVLVVLTGVVLFELVSSVVVVGLDWRLRSYLVTDRAIRVREGVLNVREMTLSLANVQNVELKQGPLARLLGIADLEVRTAGGGDGAEGAQGSGMMHKARFVGIDDAEAVRDLILARVKAAQGAGLGDPAANRRAPPPRLPSASREVAAAAAELLAAARALRAEAEIPRRSPPEPVARGGEVG